MHHIFFGPKYLAVYKDSRGTNPYSDSEKSSDEHLKYDPSLRINRREGGLTYQLYS